MTPFAIEPITQKGAMDCGAATLAMLMGKPYRDVAEVALALVPTVHQSGLWLTQLRKIAKHFGFTLVKRAVGEDETGLMDLRFKDRRRHYAVLFQGVLIDPADSLVWDLSTYLATHNASLAALYELHS